MTTDRIGVPDETPCPQCGVMMEASDDVMGTVFSCYEMDCMGHYDAEELFPEAYEDEQDKPQQAATEPILDWGVYKCSACGAMSVGALLGYVDYGSKKGKRCCADCSVRCTDLVPVRRYKIAERS